MEPADIAQPPKSMRRALNKPEGRGSQQGSTAKLSIQLEGWLSGEGDKSLGSLIDVFGDKSFALLLVLLLAVPALPLPTGGVTHVFEVIAALIALELIVGRHEVWLPRRWRSRQLAGARQQRFIAKLTGLIRWLERRSRPRLRVLFHRRFTDILFGVFVLAGTVGAFMSPPFSGLDTLPALGVVLVSLAVLLEDFAIVVAGTVVGITGIVLEIVLGAAAMHAFASII